MRRATTCFQCNSRHLNCHSACPHYVQPEDKYKPRDQAESDYIDYVKQRSRKLKGVRI